MICKTTVKRICKDFIKIENYEKAIADKTQTWDCHHRLETHNSDGERRLVDLIRPELMALGMYYDRPPEELIFLTRAEHTSLHKKGKHPSEETKVKLSIANKGEKNPQYGRSPSEETRKMLSAANKGKKRSEETKAKISAANKGKKFGSHSEEWKRKMSEVFKGKKREPFSEEWKRKLSEAHKGKRSPMKGKPRSEETKAKISATLKGKHWKLVDGKRVWY